MYLGGEHDSVGVGLLVSWLSLLVSWLSLLVTIRFIAASACKRSQTTLSTSKSSNAGKWPFTFHTCVILVSGAGAVTILSLDSVYKTSTRQRPQEWGRGQTFFTLSSHTCSYAMARQQSGM